ncbi:hypothetical protein BP5796_11700 [Coleophoma crateriformis]|uniref:Uncharacterized protein n=1 Tax=Coleophoma crateriformis TaxID=565419 RepID=A0A3D8QF94_9HELO|nr:hypothetical protein BP5796_11700 [Coleophoma crateriformis]
MAVMEDSRQRASGLFIRAQNIVDRVVSPEARQKSYDNVKSFATEQPILASFILVQLLLSITPLLLFVSFVTSTFLFAAFCAVIFSLFWAGIALLILTPTLFITVGFGLLLWTWALSSYLVAKWVYSLIPVNVSGNAKMEMPNGNNVVVKKTGDGYGDIKAEFEHAE